MPESPMAMCPHCREPLICTLLFPKYEFYCLCCGRHFGWLSPAEAEPTPELFERHKQLQAEWEEYAQPRLRVVSVWLAGCEKCEPRGEYHSAHATDEERQEHENALAWLKQRVAEGC